MKRRVVVTGIGCITPLGNNVQDLWQALQDGRSGVGGITHFEAANFPT
ncbi:MAG: beta-ketoacyl synthase N-terminal-like domain-containing protein, partial [Fuerstiella sp.]